MGSRTSYVVLCAVLLAPAVAFGQQLRTNGNESNFGRVRLAAGFEPDPHSVSVKSGGGLNASEMRLGAGCTGYVTAEPDFILDLSSSSSMLRFMVDAPGGDTSLIVNGADGRWYCDDDSGGGTNPMVTIRDAESGQYDVWVGSYTSGQEITGTIQITERDIRPGNASAQLQTNGSDSNFGRVRLAPGFEPDPHEVTVKSGGDVSVSTLGLGPGCTGYVTTKPDFILDYSGQSAMLRFMVQASGDTSLIVNGADGRWYCDDDSGGGNNPMVTLQDAASGQYDVWVGSYTSGQDVDGKLQITERDIRPGGSGAQLQTGGNSSNFGRAELRAGFEPDPHRVSVKSGGDINAASLGLAPGCTGYVTAQPDFILQLSGSSDSLRFKVESGGDTSLIVNGADGRWYCDDDSGGGTNPMVRIGDAAEGQYDVWVGSYTSGEELDGTLLITEREPRPGKGG